MNRCALTRSLVSVPVSSFNQRWVPQHKRPRPLRRAVLVDQRHRRADQRGQVLVGLALVAEQQMNCGAAP